MVLHDRAVKQVALSKVFPFTILASESKSPSYVQVDLEGTEETEGAFSLPEDESHDDEQLVMNQVALQLSSCLLLQRIIQTKMNNLV